MYVSSESSFVSDEIFVLVDLATPTGGRHYYRSQNSRGQQLLELLLYQSFLHVGSTKHRYHVFLMMWWIMTKIYISSFWVVRHLFCLIFSVCKYETYDLKKMCTPFNDLTFSLMIFTTVIWGCDFVVKEKCLGILIMEKQRANICANGLHFAFTLTVDVDLLFEAWQCWQSQCAESRFPG